MMKEQNHDGKHRLKGGREFRRRLVWELAMNRGAGARGDGARALATVPDSPASRVAARRRRPPSVPATAAAMTERDAEYGEHVAISRSKIDGGVKLTCVYCAARAEEAKRSKQRVVPSVHQSIMVCSSCVKEKRGRGRGDSRVVPLCTHKRRGAAHSCFWLWHEAKFGCVAAAADADAAATSAATAMPMAGQAAAADIANA